MLGNVDTGVIGRRYACISMHPHEKLVIMELLLQHLEKTIIEILDEVYTETGSEYACSTLHYYLKRNKLTRKVSSRTYCIHARKSHYSYAGIH